MKNPKIHIHELPVMAEFEHCGRRYRTVTHLKHRAVHAGQKRDVINLQTNKIERIGYFETIYVLSEKIENSEK